MTTGAAYAQSNPLLDQCRKAAQPTWDKGGRGNTYEGNDVYRTCLKDQITKCAKDVFPADKQAAFTADMGKAADQITQVYTDIGDVIDKAGRRKAFDPTADASDLSFYENLLQALSTASGILKEKVS